IRSASSNMGRTSKDMSAEQHRQDIPWVINSVQQARESPKEKLYPRPVPNGRSPLSYEVLSPLSSEPRPYERTGIIAYSGPNETQQWRLPHKFNYTAQEHREIVDDLEPRRLVQSHVPHIDNIIYWHGQCVEYDKWDTRAARFNLSDCIDKLYSAID